MRGWASAGEGKRQVGSGRRGAAQADAEKATVGQGERARQVERAATDHRGPEQKDPEQLTETVRGTRHRAQDHLSNAATTGRHAPPR